MCVQRTVSACNNTVIPSAGSYPVALLPLFVALPVLVAFLVSALAFVTRSMFVSAVSVSAVAVAALTAVSFWNQTHNSTE